MACALAAALVVQSQPVHAQDAAPAGPIAPDATASAEGRTTAETPQAPIADPASAETPAHTEVTPDATAAERMAAGKALYAQRKYVEAARVYDSVGTTNALYNAAMSLAAAGHDAHALLLWTRYLEVAPEDERAEVQESIDAPDRGLDVDPVCSRTAARRALLARAALARGCRRRSLADPMDGACQQDALVIGIVGLLMVTWAMWSAAARVHCAIALNHR